VLITRSFRAGYREWLYSSDGRNEQRESPFFSFFYTAAL